MSWRAKTTPMTVILWAFTLFHLVVGVACAGAAIRLLAPTERRLWRSPVALIVAELLVWIYPVAAFVGARSAWQAYEAGHPFALTMMITPIAWLFVMGLVFAVVDFAEDGIIGNARAAD